MNTDQTRTWKTSSYTGSNGNCVEVAAGSTVAVRDTKDRDGGMLTVSSASWTAFTAILGQN
jgi:hypothetical protein